MAKRGTKPKPTALKVLEGNPGQRRLNENEPMPDPSLPDPPEHLDTAACEEWFRLAAELNRLGILTQVDRAAFAAYCQNYSRWQYAEQELQLRLALGENPYVSVTRLGNVIQHPLVGVSNKAQELMLKFMVEFGLTPSSRVRISVPKQAASDPFEEAFVRG